MVGINNSNPYLPYSNNKIQLNTRQFYKSLLEQDLHDLEEDWKLKQSSGEPELLPFVEEALRIV